MEPKRGKRKGLENEKNTSTRESGSAVTLFGRRGVLREGGTLTCAISNQILRV